MWPYRMFTLQTGLARYSWSKSFSYPSRILPKNGHGPGYCCYWCSGPSREPAHVFIHYKSFSFLYIHTRVFSNRSQAFELCRLMVGTRLILSTRAAACFFSPFMVFYPSCYLGAQIRQPSQWRPNHCWVIQATHKLSPQVKSSDQETVCVPSYEETLSTPLEGGDSSPPLTDQTEA